MASEHRPQISDDPGDSSIQFTLGTLYDGRVLFNFGRYVDHMKLTPEQALELAEGLVDAAREANNGRTIFTGSHQDRG